MMFWPLFRGSLEKNMNESSKSYLYGNPRLSAAEWRTNLDNTDTAETLQSMQDIGKNAEWLRAYLQENDTPIEELGLPGREYNELKRSKINTMGDMLALYPDFSVGRGSHIGAQTAKRMRRVVEKFCKRLLDEAHLLVMPGSGFGKAGAGHFRIACTVDIDKLRLAYDRMEKLSF